MNNDPMSGWVCVSIVVAAALVFIVDIIASAVVETKSKRNEK